MTLSCAGSKIDVCFFSVLSFFLLRFSILEVIVLDNVNPDKEIHIAVGLDH